MKLTLETKGMADFELLESCTTINKAKEVLGIDDIKSLPDAFNNAAQVVMQLFQERARLTFTAYYENLVTIKINQKKNTYYKASSKAALKKVDIYELFTNYSSGDIRFKQGDYLNLENTDIHILRSSVGHSTVSTYNKMTRDLSRVHAILTKRCFEATNTSVLKAKELLIALGHVDLPQDIHSTPGTILKDALYVNSTKQGLQEFNETYQVLAQLVSSPTRAYQLEYDESELDVMLGLVKSLEKDIEAVRKAQKRLAQNFFTGVTTLGNEGKIKPAVRAEDGWIDYKVRAEYRR